MWHCLAIVERCCEKVWHRHNYICANLVIFWSLLMFNKVLFIYPKIF